MTVPVIIDNDFNTDYGDYTALAVGLALERMGEIAIEALLVDSTPDAAATAASTILHYYGRDAIPVGIFKGAAPSANVSTTTAVCTGLPANFPHPAVTAGSVSDAVAVARTALAARASADTTYVLSGFWTVLNALLASPADGISALTGVQLFTASVNRVVVMGGDYPSSSGSYNFAGAPAAANTALAALPAGVNVYFIGDTFGAIVSGLTVSQLGTTSTHPLVYAATNNTPNAINGRQSWDVLAVLNAARSTPADLGMTAIQGTNVMNATTGANTFTIGAGHHFVLAPNARERQYVKEIDRMLVPGGSVG